MRSLLSSKTEGGLKQGQPVRLLRHIGRSGRAALAFFVFTVRTMPLEAEAVASWISVLVTVFELTRM